MIVGNQHYRTIWIDENDKTTVKIIDQSKLPFQFTIVGLASVSEVADSIKDMRVRGAGLIGAAAGYGMYLAALEASKGKNFDDEMKKFTHQLIGTRPTAVNLKWAVDRQIAVINKQKTLSEKIEAALHTAEEIANEDAFSCRKIGEYGFEILKNLGEKKKDGVLNILTHCNAGWLAFVDYGTATAPIYKAFEMGMNLHVWVDETRPRNQGARLTAWELGKQGIPHTVIADNTGGHLMQHNLVDIVITGSDRTTRTGDVANKIGTYLKALAANDNNVPFYVALPSSTFDWGIEDGLKQIPIEERDADEVRWMEGTTKNGLEKVLIMPESSRAANYAFDVTPARLVTGLITERGVCKAEKKDIQRLFPDKFQKNG